MILSLFVSFAKPELVVTFDNGGFNLPLYTSRWNGKFEQPSIAQQVTSDIARLQNRAPRVFTYLPPGRAAGRSSEPFEVLSARPGCPECQCTPGDRCWDQLQVNRHPAASTSLYQAVSAVQKRVGNVPHFEIHFTDLFEEDPSGVKTLADADQCVTESSTRRAIEAVVSSPGERLDHLAVGRLVAKISPPRLHEGGLVEFLEQDGGCWKGHRVRSFGAGGDEIEFEMAVLVLGIGTAAFDQEFQSLVDGLVRQVSDAVTLELVVVREPPTRAIVPIQSIAGAGASIPLPTPPRRQTPCENVEASVGLFQADRAVEAHALVDCDDGGRLVISPTEIEQVYRSVAGLNPFVRTLAIAGRVEMSSDVDAIQSAVVGISNPPPTGRPLVFWPALVEALRFDSQEGAWRPRRHDVVIEQLSFSNIDPRPWLLSSVFSILLMGICTGILSMGLGRIATNRALERHLKSSDVRPVAVIMHEALEEARAGFPWRVLLSVLVSIVIGGGVFWGILFLDRVIHG